jgi:hypothetical protein
MQKILLQRAKKREAEKRCSINVGDVIVVETPAVREKRWKEEGGQ